MRFRSVVEARRCKRKVDGVRWYGREVFAEHEKGWESKEEVRDKYRLRR